MKHQLMQTVQGEQAPVTTDATLVPKKRKPGLPAKIPADMIEHISKLSGLGLTQEQIAHYHHVSVDTLAKRMKDDPRLDIAMRSGKAQSLEKASAKLWAKVEQGNLSAIIFYLKTQGRWRETDYNESGSSGGAPVPALTLTVHDPVEASKIYQQIMLGS